VPENTGLLTRETPVRGIRSRASDWTREKCDSHSRWVWLRNSTYVQKTPELVPWISKFPVLRWDPTLEYVWDVSSHPVLGRRVDFAEAPLSVVPPIPSQ